MEGRPVEAKAEGTFDELTVDHWLRVEQLDDRTWWLRVGDARLNVVVEASGDVRVDVERGFYDDVRGDTTAYKVP